MLSCLKWILSQVPTGVSVPDSAALPFGTFERTLKDHCNSDAALGISACMDDLEVGVPIQCCSWVHRNASAASL